MSPSQGLPSGRPVIPPAPRSFVMSTLGLTLLFAAFGPAVGGVVFLPLAIALEVPLALLHMAWLAGLAGHAFALIPAYVVGLGPAAATGFLYALWDALAPERWPRSLVGAAIGGAMAHGALVWLASLGASVETSVTVNMGPNAERWADAVFSGAFDARLKHAFEASGAVAGFACAVAAGLFGLTTRAPATHD